MPEKKVDGNEEHIVCKCEYKHDIIQQERWCSFLTLVLLVSLQLY